MKKMLSELILEGAKLRPQGFRDFIDNHGCSCARGAALESTGRLDASEIFFNDTHTIENQYPDGLPELIDKWNDHDKLSREAIAQKLIDEGLDVEITF